MTITVIYQPTVAAVSGNDYAFTWDAVGLEAIEVWAVDASDVRTFIPQTAYTVAFTGSLPVYDGGTVTLTQALPAGTTQVSVERNTPITQTVDLPDYGRFSDEEVEFMADKLTMILQEISARKCDKVDQNAI